MHKATGFTRWMMLLLLVWLGLHGAAAQDFPTRPIRMTVIFAAGSTLDLQARYLAPKLQQFLGQPVIVENSGGAGGILAMRSVSRTTPPGYNLLLTTNGFVGNLHIFKDPQYRFEDYAMVGVVGLGYYSMMLHSSVPARTVQEFVAYAKANPGKLNYGSSGPTAGSNILAERLKAAAGLDMVQIPFKGGEPATAALLGGQIQLYFSTVGAVRNRVKSSNGLIRAIGVSSDKRSEIMPELQTFKEAGYPNMDVSVWQVILTAAATPRPALQKLQEAMAGVNALPDMKAHLIQTEFEPWTGTLDQFTAFMRAEGQATAEDIRKLKIPLQD